jgi:hypothetical protein
LYTQKYLGSKVLMFKLHVQEMDKTRVTTAQLEGWVNPVLNTRQRKTQKMQLTRICTIGSSTLPPASITYKKNLNLFMFHRSFTEWI